MSHYHSNSHFEPSSPLYREAPANEKRSRFEMLYEKNRELQHKRQVE